MYIGIYRDDGFVVFNRRLDFEGVGRWLKTFQSLVNAKTGGEWFVFTVVIWDKGKKNIGTDKDILSLDGSDRLSYLDMYLGWNETETGLTFSVYRKPGQRLKYVDNLSCHTPATRMAIPAGVFKRLAKLTSWDPGDENRTVRDLYPAHALALTKAELDPDKWPKMKELWREQEKNDQKRLFKIQKKSNFDKRAVKFVVSYTKYWGDYFRLLIRDLRKEFGLSWLRIQFCYKRFTNLREKFQGDLTVKIQRGLNNADYADNGCNCYSNVKDENGMCAYKGKCNMSVIVYQVTCRNTGKIFITFEIFRAARVANFYEFSF